MTSKTKTFEAESEFRILMNWFMTTIETKDVEVVGIVPPDLDVEVRTTKKYRITISEVDSLTKTEKV